MEGIPEFRVLGYQASRPRLRLLSLPGETIEPSPVAVNAQSAIDHGFARDGWHVFKESVNVWGVPASLEGRAFRVGRWWACVRAPNPRTVWLGHPADEARADDGPAVVAEYDGVLRRELARHVLAEPLNLAAAVPAGLILQNRNLVGDRSLDVIWLWPFGGGPAVEIGPGWEVEVAHGSLLVVTHRVGEPRERAIGLLDATTGIETRIQKPLPGQWNAGGSFSPDGAWFVTSVEELDRGPLVAQVTAADLAGRDVHELFGLMQRTRLALIDTATGAVTLLEPRFEGFASDPVWTADSRWLIFDAPFDKSLFACDVRDPAPRLTPIVRRRGRPSPLVDVTA